METGGLNQKPLTIKPYPMKIQNEGKRSQIIGCRIYSIRPGLNIKSSILVDPGQYETLKTASTLTRKDDIRISIIVILVSNSLL